MFFHTALEALACLWTRDHERFLLILCMYLIQVNVVFVKVVQALVVRHAPKMVGITNNVFPLSRYSPPAIDGVVFDPRILGSGMVAVVYSGKIGEEAIVVKVKREGVEAEIQRGLRTIQRIFWVAERLPWLSKVRWSLLFQETSGMLLEQLDFEKEVASQQKYRDMFEYNPWIVVPKIVTCTRDYIVMERLFPVKPDATLNDHYARLICNVATKSAILDGFLHADFHPGNLMFLPEGKLGIVDFGLTLELTVEQKNAYVLFCGALNRGNYAEVADHVLTDYFVVRPSVSPAKGSALNVLERLFQENDERDTGFGVHEIAVLIDKLYPLGYTITPYFYKMLMAIAASDALFKSLSPSIANMFKKEMLKITN